MSHDLMTPDAMHDPPPSHEALWIFGYLHTRGGSMRLGPMLRHLRMDQRAFIAATIDLNERCWIRIVWREAGAGSGDDETRPLAEVYRLCTTRFGRLKYRSTWRRAG
jgi:hypothetical protein